MRSRNRHGRYARRFGPATISTVMVVALQSPALADVEVLAFSGDGTRLAVGSVVGRGTPDGGACAFQAPLGITLGTPGATVGVRVEPDCSVVVSELGIAAGTVHGVPRGPFVPASDESAAAVLTQRGTAHLVPNATAPRDPVELRSGIVSQTIYDEAGIWQFEEYFEVGFERNRRNGDLQNVFFRQGYCSANAAVLLVSNEVRACHASVPQRGPSVVEMRGGGAYRQTVLGQERMSIRTADKFVAVRDTNGRIDDDAMAECFFAEGRLPYGWSSYCYGNETERLDD